MRKFTKIAATSESEEQIVFTPSAVLDLLSQIDELANVSVGLSETVDGKIQIAVGDSTYLLEDAAVKSIDVEPDVVDSIDEVNLDTYQDLMDSGNVEYVDDEEPVTGGIIKEGIKALLLGGMIRFASKHLLK